MVPQMRERVPKGAMHYLRQLYYDTALSTSDAALSALKHVRAEDTDRVWQRLSVGSRAGRESRNRQL